MNPIWLIEANIEGLPSEELQSEIRQQGLTAMTVKPFLHNEFPRDILGAEEIPIDASVIFTGTLDLMRYIQNHRRWLPGGWCNFENLACTTYYSYFGKYLLNSNYTVMPVVEAIRQQEWLYSVFARDGQIFVRPDSVDKSFTGRLLHQEDFEPFLRTKAHDPRFLVVVSSPKKISVEWRLFVANGRVVTGSQYRSNHVTKVAPGVPDSVLDFAEDILKNTSWRPDSLFVMDVCDSNNELNLVELNSFSCSGPCRCDLGAYVAAAISAARLC